MSVLLVGNQKNEIKEDCNFYVINSPFVKTWRENYIIRLKKRAYDLALVNVFPTTDVGFSSFWKKDIQNLIDDALDEDFLVFKYGINQDNKLGFYNTIVTPVIMAENVHTVKKHSQRGGRTGGKLGKLLTRQKYVDNIIELFKSRNAAIKHIPDYEYECQGIAYKIKEIKCILELSGNFLNVFMMFSPVRKINSSDQPELKTSCGFYISDSREDSLPEIQPDYTLTNKMIFLEPLSPLAVYDNGHECCPI